MRSQPINGINYHLSCANTLTPNLSPLQYCHFPQFCTEPKRNKKDTALLYKSGGRFESLCHVASHHQHWKSSPIHRKTLESIRIDEKISLLGGQP